MRTPTLPFRAFVETSIAVVSACLPTLGPVYKYATEGSEGLIEYSFHHTSGDTNGIGLTKSMSPWRNGQVGKEGELGRLECGREGGDRLPEGVLGYPVCEWTRAFVGNSLDLLNEFYDYVSR